MRLYRPIYKIQDSGLSSLDMIFFSLPLRATAGQASGYLAKKEPKEFEQSGLATWILLLDWHGPRSVDNNHLVEYISYRVPPLPDIVQCGPRWEL